MRWVALLAVAIMTLSSSVTATERADAATTAPSVWSWGSGALPTGQDQPTPQVVTGLPALKAVSTGGYTRSSIGLTSSGTVWAWGINPYGERGDGTTQVPNSSFTWAAPSQVPGLTGVVQVDSERSLKAAVKSDGTVWTWGRRTNFNESPTTSPTRIPGVTNVRSIALGSDLLSAGNGSTLVPGDSLALRKDGTVLLFGQQFSGTWRYSRVPGLSGIVQVGVGESRLGEHSFWALDSSGRLYAWGDNTYGQLGDGTTTARTTPQLVSGLPAISQVSPGFGFVMALDTTARVWTWGRNTYGQLGDGTTTDRRAPAPVSALAGASSVLAADANGVAAMPDGRVMTWGYSTHGELGDGTGGCSSRCTSASRPTPAPLASITGATSMSTSDGAFLVIASASSGGGTSPTDPTTPTKSWKDDACYASRKAVDGQWAFKWHVSDDDGVVLDSARLASRQAIRSMQVPNLVVTVTAGGVTKDYAAELTPTASTSSSRPVSSKLTDLTCNSRSVKATYQLSGLPNGLKIYVDQGYYFADRIKDDRCEPSGDIRCARMWPTVSWRTSAIAPSASIAVQVKVNQRMDFKPDGGGPGEAMVMRDNIQDSKNPGVEMHPHGQEYVARALDPAGTYNWDNLHMSSKEVTLPSFVVNPVTGTVNPGCPDCIHMHWKWTSLAGNGLLGSTFTNGKPAVLAGSPQVADVILVNEHLDRPEDDPTDPRHLVDGESTHGKHPIIFWSSTSKGIAYANGTYGDATFPALMDRLPGDRGGLWFSTDSPATPIG